jgi:hypothetical protein
MKRSAYAKMKEAEYSKLQEDMQEAAKGTPLSCQSHRDKCFEIHVFFKVQYRKKCLKTPTATATPTKPTPSDSYLDPTTF